MQHDIARLIDDKLNRNKNLIEIIVVDDDPSQLISIKKILSNEYLVHTFNKRKNSIQFYKDNMDTIKAIVTDIRMPDMDGFELFNIIKEINEHIPIIFITAFQEYYGDGYEVYKKFRPHGYIIKDHKDEIEMIKSTLWSATTAYNLMLEHKKGELLSVRNQTVAGLVHDQKNLLMPVMQYPEIINEFLQNGKIEEATKLNKSLMKCATIFGANQIILFNFVKAENIDIRIAVQNIDQLITNLINTVQTLFYTDVDFQLELNYPHNFPTDKTILCYQILNNIFKNSYDAFCAYNRREKIITIKTMPLSQFKEHYPSEHFSNNDNNDPVIIIKDNGPGVSENIFDKMFNAYVSSSKTGSGLGCLMIKKGIEEYLKGSFYLENTQNEGLVYYICLPVIVNNDFFGV